MLILVGLNVAHLEAHSPGLYLLDCLLQSSHRGSSAGEWEYSAIPTRIHSW